MIGTARELQRLLGPDVADAGAVAQDFVDQLDRVLRIVRIVLAVAREVGVGLGKIEGLVAIAAHRAHAAFCGPPRHGLRQQPEDLPLALRFTERLLVASSESTR